MMMEVDGALPLLLGEVVLKVKRRMAGEEMEDHQTDPEGEVEEGEEVGEVEADKMTLTLLVDLVVAHLVVQVVDLGMGINLKWTL